MAARVARRARHAAFVAVLAVPWLFGAPDRARAASASVQSVQIADAEQHWPRDGFVQMVPPIRLPSNDGVEQITVWLRIPAGATLHVSARADGSGPTLSYPVGTVADRVELRDGRDLHSVIDVRGTTFEADGVERFHVLKPFGVAGLQGFEWPRDDDAGGEQVATAMVKRLAEARGLSPDAPDRFLRAFARQNDCASCHVHEKPQRLTVASKDTDGEPAPNRATDLGGLYAIATMLRDEAPLETHRALDMNVDRPYVTVGCADGRAAQLDTKGSGRRFRCDDASIPTARYDLAAARRDGDQHATAVCFSRAYLAAHMEPQARASFADAFAECGIR